MSFIGERMAHGCRNCDDVRIWRSGEHPLSSIGYRASREGYVGVSHLIEHLAELTGSRDRDAIDGTLVSAFHTLLRPESVAIYRPVGQPHDRRWMTGARHCARQLLPGGDSNWVDIQSLPPLNAQPERCQALHGHTVTTWRCGRQLTLYPLISERAVAGVLELETLGPIDPQALETIRTVLRLYRNLQCLLDYGEHDTLTGLLNRKSFDVNFNKIVKGSLAAAPNRDEQRRSAAAGERYWLGMIDIDFFKSVNDRFGHLIGDEVLLLLARLMATNFRCEDRLYRFGGEEFVALMRCRSDSDAVGAFERLRALTQQHVFPQVHTITVSIGYTEIIGGDSPIAALGRADEALYYVKQHGRNQLRGYAELTASGALKVLNNVGSVELF